MRKIATGQGDDYTTGCSLGYPCLKNQMITIDLIKQQAIDVDQKAMQHINFTANLD